jgi:hypothetical protein
VDIVYFALYAVMTGALEVALLLISNKEACVGLKINGWNKSDRKDRVGGEQLEATEEGRSHGNQCVL